MPSIGPYTFPVMNGRFAVASLSTVPTTRGLKPGKRRPQPVSIRTYEEHASFVSAWLQAAWYRAAVGALSTAVDDGGITVYPVLISDCRALVRPLAGGRAASLEVVWTMTPGVGWGDAGLATSYVDLNAGSYRFLEQPAVAQQAGTTITVGSIAFDTATGDLQWPLSSSQRTDVVQAAKGIGADQVVQPPSMSDGTLSCTLGLASEQAGFDLMRRCRQLVGGYADVQFGGITIPGVAVEDVDVTWQLTVGLPNSQTHLATITWKMAIQEDNGNGDNLGTVAMVQVASVWGAWQTVKDAVCNDAVEGVNASVGQAPWFIDIGTTLRGGKAITHEPTDYGGMWCRVLKRVKPNGNPDSKSTTTIPVWHGVVQSTEITVANGSSVMHACTSGILAALEQVWITNWYEIGQNGATIDPGEIPPFNDQHGGDASTTDGGFVGGNPATVHHRHRSTGTDPEVPAPLRWRADRIVATIMRAIREQYPEGPYYEIGGQTSALEFLWDGDLRNKNALQQLAEIISPRWGMVFRPEVSGNTVTLRICTTVRVNTAIPAGPTIPANDRQIAIDTRPTEWNPVSLKRDHTQQVDAVYAEGGHGWYAATLGLWKPGARAAAGKTADFVNGWSTAVGTTWTTATDIQRESDKLAPVYHRFVLRSDWNGGTYFAPTRNDLMAIRRALDGSGQETGEFLPATGGIPKASTVKFSRQLPCSQGVDWSDTDQTYQAATLIRPHTQLEGPMIFAKDRNGHYENLTHRWQITVEDGGGAILLGRTVTEARDIKAYLDSEKAILITIGIVFPMTWRASWRRAKADRPRQQERAIKLNFPQLTYQQFVSGTIVGLTNNTTVKQVFLDGGRPVRGDFAADPAAVPPVARVVAYANQARMFYENPWRPFRGTRKGVLDNDAEKAPGSLFTDITLPLDATRTMTEASDSVCTARSWNFRTDAISTSYTSDRILPAFDKFAQTPLTVNPGALSNIVGGYHGR